MEDCFVVNMIFGTVTPETDYRLENGRYVCYSRRVVRDRNNVITETSEWEPLRSMGWDDGSPMTENDIKVLQDATI